MKEVYVHSDSMRVGHAKSLLRKKGQAKQIDKIPETQSIAEAGITGTGATTCDSDGSPAS